MSSVKGITINTDASFYNSHKVGGYAFWIKCDLFKITKAGKFKNEVIDATDAEMKAIANALTILIDQKELPEAKFLVINTDSKHSIERITKQSDELGIRIYALWQTLIQLLKSEKNDFRHVKSHSGKNDARSYVNEWCDKEAKKWARKALQEKNELLNQKVE